MIINNFLSLVILFLTVSIYIGINDNYGFRNLLLKEDNGTKSLTYNDTVIVNDYTLQDYILELNNTLFSIEYSDFEDHIQKNKNKFTENGFIEFKSFMEKESNSMRKNDILFSETISQEKPVILAYSSNSNKQKSWVIAVKSLTRFNGLYLGNNGRLIKENIRYFIVFADKSSEKGLKIESIK
ncbi:hypothetical protein [Photobacterium leiognathi]|uniref:hypothetical protein n=1 Tax=Photobacterium leiognathi TaxID=553611 RepID=UPI002980C5AF|nr:hypothetical protein [Photobacterium leiognathi]